jgi:lipid-binding SYLF domain-containing protein
MMERFQATGFADSVNTLRTMTAAPTGGLRLFILLLTLQCTAWAEPVSAREDIDRAVDETLAAFRAESPQGAEMMKSAAGVLVFPDVVRIGFGIGGEYGEGALLVDGLPVGYYSTSGASFGLQLGAQSRAQVILFMTERALMRFRRSRGWEAGVDGNITVVEETAGGDISSLTADASIVGFVFSNRGLMYNLTFEGNTINPLQP